MSDRREPRIVPPWQIWVLLLPPFLGAFWMAFVQDDGDGGIRNAIAYVSVLLAGLIYGLWFLLGSGQPAGRKLKACGLVLVLAVAVLATVRIDGWTGDTRPILRWAWAEPPPELATEAIESEAGVDLATVTPDDFAGFLGPARDGRVRHVTLAREWRTAPPEVLWRVPVGAAWSGFAVVNGTAVTMEQRGEEQVVVARSLDDGSELWRYAHPGFYDHQLAGAGPHATPTIDRGLVFAYDVYGKVVCLNGRDGSLKWMRDLKADYGMTDELEAELMTFGRSPSPLIVDDLVVVAAGGNPAEKQAGLVALDRLSGETVWEGPPRQISHASPNLATLAGVRQIVVTNEDTLSGHDPATGELLWEHDWSGSTNSAANNSQPTIVGDDRVLMSKGYGQGSALIRLARTDPDAQALTVEPLWAAKRPLRTKLTNPVIHDGHAYALSDGILECVAIESGDRVWREGRYGHGQILLVGEGSAALLLVLSEEGELLLVVPTPSSEGRVLGRMELLDSLTWNTLALYGDRLLVRNGEEAVCLRLPVVAE